MSEPEFRQRGPISQRIGLALGDTFSEHELGVLSELGRVVDYEQGSTLVTEGHDGDAAAVVVEGTVDVVRHGDTVASLGTGSIIGEMALLTGSPRTATLVAATPLTVLTLGPKGFASLLEQCPRLEPIVHAVADRRGAAE